mgnify:CR=1 FL=1
MRIFIYSRTAGHRGRLKTAAGKYISINKIRAPAKKPYALSQTTRPSETAGSRK